MTSSDVPELEDLPFYQQLISNHSEFYAKVQGACSFIVIPQHLNAVLLKRDAFESHIFRPSPMYLRKHVSWNDKYEIEFDNNRAIRFFYKKQGAGEKRIKILSQEDVRDSVRQRTYTILIIEQPLIDLNGFEQISNNPLYKPIIRTLSPTIPRFNASTASYESSFVFLDSLRQIEPAFTRLCTDLFSFTDKYVVLPKFLNHAIDKLRLLRTQFLQDSYRLLNRQSEDRDIELASEIYVTGYVYTKVWPTILESTESKEKLLFENIRIRQRKQRANSNDFPANSNQSASNELKRLDDLKSSYEKAKCIRSTLDLTIAAKTLMVVDAKNSAVAYHSSSEGMAMAADETLTAFIDLICQLVSNADVNSTVHLVAHEYYTENFRFLPLPQDIDYAFTTYRGVIEYLTNSSTVF